MNPLTASSPPSHNSTIVTAAAQQLRADAEAMILRSWKESVFVNQPEEELAQAGGDSSSGPCISAGHTGLQAASACVHACVLHNAQQSDLSLPHKRAMTSQRDFCRI